MKLQVFAIYDRAAGIYSHLHCHNTLDLALRDFEQVALDSNSKINRHAHDFSLWHIGVYDDETAQTQNLQAPVLIRGAQTVLDAARSRIQHSLMQSPTALQAVAPQAEAVAQ